MKTMPIRFARMGLMLSAALAALAAAAMLTLGAGRAQADAANTWPEIKLPPDVQAYAISPRMTLDGVITELQGFDSAQSPQAVAAWLRANLPAPLLEDRLGPKLVLGHPEGPFYTTITLEAAGEGTHAVVSVADLGSLAKASGSGVTPAERLLAGFPSGTQVLRSMTSTENARSATYTALVNGYSEELNRERLLTLLQADGLRLENEVAPDAAGLEQLPPGMAAGTTLFFKGPGKEATAVIARGAGSQVTVVLNTLTTMEQFK